MSVDTAPDGSHDHQAGTTGEASPGTGRDAAASPVTLINPESFVPPPSVDAYLANLGLAHIKVPLAAPAATSFASSSTMPTSISVPVPSRMAASLPYNLASDFSTTSLENGTDLNAQNGTRQGKDRGGHKWDKDDPVADLKLGGVPSLPLMPAPALQMLPPPDSPAFLLEHFAKTAGRWEQVKAQQQQQQGNVTLTVGDSGVVGTASRETAAGAAATEAEFRGKFTFQVVQTPGGTARPGWWIPTSAIPESERKNAVVITAAADQQGIKNSASAGQFFQPR